MKYNNNMSSVLSTVADLLENLGGVPTHRVLLNPAPGTARERDVLKSYSRDRRLCELVDGVLVEKAMGYYEAYLAGLLIQALNNFLDKNDIGIVAGADGMVRLAEGLIRIPDISFIRWERLPGKNVPRDPIAGLAPDLAVEILSKTNTRREMKRKLEEYFRAGVQMAWLLDHEKQTVEVYTSPQEKVVVSEGGNLTGGGVLPGFSLDLSDFFKKASRKGPARQ